MRWFLDTEFNENGKTIELISIALVSETGEEYYAVICFHPVITIVRDELVGESIWKTRTEVANEIRELVLRDGEPEFWGYFSDYDWVVLCQLYGPMIALPKGFPMFCLDLKQEMHRLGITKDRLPPQPEDAHSVLADAHWIRKAWLWVVGGRYLEGPT